MYKMKKRIKVKFCDGPTKYTEYRDEILRILQQEYDVEMSENPDYVFYSCHGKEFLKYSDAVRVFYVSEALMPDFNLCDYALSYDNICVGDRFHRWNSMAILESDEVEEYFERPVYTKEDLDNKEYCFTYVVSNGEGDKIRDEAYDVFDHYKKVFSGGAHRNNIGRRVESKDDFIARGKFNIAFENADYDYYSTEKILDAYRNRTIPIYWGNKYIHKDYNRKAFINCHEYKTLEDVLSDVKKIDQDDTLYLNMVNEELFSYEDWKSEHNNLIGFLKSIIDKPKEQAIKRNRTQRGVYYENEYKLKERKIDENKAKVNYEVACKWLMSIQNEKNILEILEKRNIKNPMIYGYGVFGKLILQEFEKSPINISGIIDKNIYIQNEKYKCFSTDDNLPLIFDEYNVDAVVCSVEYNVEKIVAQFNDMNIKVPVIKLSELFS